MNRRGKVKNTDGDVSKRNQEEDVKVAEEPKQYRRIFIKLSELFETIWNGCFRRIILTKHRVDLERFNQHSIHSITYHAKPKARKFEKEEVEYILAKIVIMLAQIEWAAPIAFALQKDGPLHSCVDYRKLNAGTVRGSYLLPHIVECIEYPKDGTAF